MGRRGAALLFTAVALTAIGLALVLFHRQAVGSRQLARAAMAAAQAREAGAVGLERARGGVGLVGALPGSAQWQSGVDTLPGGGWLVWSIGAAAHSAPARLEAIAVVLPVDTTVPGTPAGLQGLVHWLVLRP